MAWAMPRRRLSQGNNSVTTYCPYLKLRPRLGSAQLNPYFEIVISLFFMLKFVPHTMTHLYFHKIQHKTSATTFCLYRVILGRVISEPIWPSAIFSPRRRNMYSSCLIISNLQSPISLKYATNLWQVVTISLSQISSPTTHLLFLPLSLFSMFE